MEPLGLHLRQAREKRKVTLKQASDDTRISQRYLQSLEEGRYKELPGGMYNRAFLRAYCEYLTLDSSELLPLYEAENTPPSEKAGKAKTKVAQPDSITKPNPIFMWSLMLALSVAGLYFSRGKIAAIFSPYFSHPVAVPAQIPRTAEPARVPPGAGSPAVTSAQGPAVTDTVPAVTQNPTGPVVQETPAQKETAQAAQPAGGIHLQFEVLQKCWVSVNSDGSPVLVKVLEPGDQQEFDAAEQFNLVLGNAGGVRIRINGKLAKPLGKPGAVVRILINEQNIPDLLEPGTG